MNVKKLNASTPFLQGVPNSMVSKEWYRVLIAIVSVLAGQSSSIDFAAFQTEYETSREPKDYDPEISELQVLQVMTQRSLSLALALAARVKEIETQLTRARPSDSPLDADLTRARPSDSPLDADLTRARPSDSPVDADPALLRRPAKIYAVPTGAAVATTAATNVTPYGFSSSQANAIVSLVNAMQQAGINNGLFS